MDYQLNADQQTVADSLNKLLQRRAGPARFADLYHKQQVDETLTAELFDSGFTGIALQEPFGALESVLVTEAVAKAAGQVSIGANAIVAAQLTGTVLPGEVAITRVDEKGPVRFADKSSSLFVLDGDEARLIKQEPGSCESVDYHFGYTGGYPDSEGGETLGVGSGERLLAWWRVAVAAETLGNMQAAMDLTLEHVRRRRQFGRELGSFQALQHRLAECAVRIEATRYLTYYAADNGASTEDAALAAGYAADSATQLFYEMHQMTGAMGFTFEHDLYVWSMKLQALRTECGGATIHFRELAQTRWL